MIEEMLKKLAKEFLGAGSRRDPEGSHLELVTLLKRSFIMGRASSGGPIPWDLSKEKNRGKR